jgi:anti-sigma regulatory factor (Ser/Thr protein kinase)
MPEADLDLPADLSAARRGRAFVRSRMCPEHAGDVLDRALLVMSELIVNAVEHGSPPVRAWVDCRSGVLRLEVSDGSAVEPQLSTPGVDAESGRGVALVAVVSSAWGVRPGPGGKTVWCDLSA